VSLERMLVADVVAGWRPDTRNLAGEDDGGPWTWERAVETLYREDRAKQLRIERLVWARGLGYADDTEPIVLAVDGTVADGHHRLAVAVRHGMWDRVVNVDRRTIRDMTETLPFEPPFLRELIESIKYKPGWDFNLGVFREDGEARAWAFYVVSDTENSFDFTKRIRVRHEFLIPPASWNRDTWAAWLFDRVCDVEKHEAGEFFRIFGVREFAPHHGNGEDPYRVWHVSDWATADKSSGDD
jgi:hypothetical protein